ncbi:ParA family protein [Glaciihabitans sp. INWT7]|uniref:ParA family protein n=1 Tax=Glaciihabitans sp. INWT7 TaxID=2596912 RepID=UPI0016276467|nr:ParA family protein [Glaciihabitans sp. INWT7]
MITLINNKGGVGKSMLTANIGGLLASSSWKVLLVDLDPQGNISDDLGITGTDDDDDGEGLARILLQPDATPVPLKNVRPNLDLLVGGTALEEASAELAHMKYLGQVTESRVPLANQLAKIAGEYDIVLIDSPPGNDVIQSLAVTATRYILIPSKTDARSVKGIVLTARRLDKLIDLNPDVDLLGVIAFGLSKGAVKLLADFKERASQALGRAVADRVIFDSYAFHATATADKMSETGLLAHELDIKVRNGPKWYERWRAGKQAEPAGPASVGSIADSMQAITTELIAKLEAAEAKAAEESNV